MVMMACELRGALAVRQTPTFESFFLIPLKLSPNPYGKSFLGMTKSEISNLKSIKRIHT